MTSNAIEYNNPENQKVNSLHSGQGSYQVHLYADNCGSIQREADRLLRARRRLLNMMECGSNGVAVLYYVRNEEGDEDRWVRYHPCSCKSIFCSECWNRRMNEVRRGVRRVWKELRIREASFLTLTLGRPRGIREGVEEAFRLKRRLYSYRITPRSWERVKRKAYELLGVYLSRIEDKKERVRRRLFHERILRGFESEIRVVLAMRGSVRVGQLLRSVWFLEWVKKDDGYHVHWHVLVLRYFPLFIIQSIWMMVGGGEIVDIRRVDTEKGVIRYLEKYVTKGVDVELDEMEMEEIESVLLGRRIVDGWGVSLRGGEVRDEGMRYGGYMGRARYHMFFWEERREILRELRKLRREGEKMTMYPTEGEIVVDVRGQEYRSRGFVDVRGRVWLLLLPVSAIVRAFGL